MPTTGRDREVAESLLAGDCVHYSHLEAIASMADIIASYREAETARLSEALARIEMLCESPHWPERARHCADIARAALDPSVVS